MVKIRPLPLVLLLGSALAVEWELDHYGVGPSDESGLCDTEWRERERVAYQAVETLRATGNFDVFRGNLTFNKMQIGNPVGKYGTLHFPDKVFPPVFCSNRTFPSANGTQMPPWLPRFCDFSFTLGPRDAIVWLGCTPPKCAYYSLRSYVAFRFKPQVWFSAAEIGDPANQLTFNTTGGKSDPFSKTALMISTGDAQTERLVRRAFTSAGFPEEATNLDVLPTDIVNFRDRNKFWITDRSDGLAWQFRVSEFYDQDQATDYFGTVWPAFYIRARRRYTKTKTLPLQQPALRERGTGKGEDHLIDPLRELERRVKHYYEHRGGTFVQRYPFAHAIPDIHGCLTDPKFMPIFTPVPEWHFPGLATCDWFTRDALYTILPNTSDFKNLMFPDNRVWVALGVNQPRVKKSVYSNFMLTAVRHFEDPKHSFNLTSGELEGSAEEFAPDVDHVESLFIYTFRRSCPSTRNRFCRDVPRSFINTTEPIYFVERKYLEEETRIGPAPDETLPPVLLAFDLPSGVDVDEGFASLQSSTMQSSGASSTLSSSSLLSGAVEGRGEGQLASSVAVEEEMRSTGVAGVVHSDMESPAEDERKERRRKGKRVRGAGGVMGGAQQHLTATA